MSDASFMGHEHEAATFPWIASHGQKPLNGAAGPEPLFAAPKKWITHRLNTLYLQDSSIIINPSALLELIMLSTIKPTSTMTIELDDSGDEFDTSDTPRFINNYPNIHTIPRPLTGYIPMWQRKFAGSNRVERCRQRRACNGAGEVLQSITAAPTLMQSSFEELRLECYLQSLVAKGGPPACAEPGKPLSALPPMYQAFVDNQPGDYLDAVMEAPNA